MATIKAEKLEYASTAYPVFVASKSISPKIVDTFLQKNFDTVEITHVEEMYQFYVVTEESLPEEHPKEQRFEDKQWPTPVSMTSAPPTSKFSPVSHFLEASVEKLYEAFQVHFACSPFTRYSFIVLDQRSAEDETCLIVHTRPGTPTTARCKFCLAVQILNAPEAVGSYNINDGKDSSKCKDPKGEEEFYYDESNWKW